MKLKKVAAIVLCMAMVLSSNTYTGNGNMYKAVAEDVETNQIAQQEEANNGVSDNLIQNDSGTDKVPVNDLSSDIVSANNSDSGNKNADNITLLCDNITDSVDESELNTTTAFTTGKDIVNKIKKQNEAVVSDNTISNDAISEDNAAAEQYVDGLLAKNDEEHKQAIYGDSMKQESNNVGETDTDEDTENDLPFDIAHPEIFESEDIEVADNTILLKFKNSFDGKLTNELKKAGVGKLEVMFDMKDYTWYTANLYKGVEVADAISKTREIDDVVIADYNYRYETAALDIDSIDAAVKDNAKLGDQDILGKCGIPKIWSVIKEGKKLMGGSSSVTVAVIDTGVDYTHEDLKANIWTNNQEIPDNGIDDDGNGYVDDYYGADMVAGRGSAMDDNGHGTHVAGIIGASNNKAGVVGIAYNTKIMPVKAGDPSGYFLQDNIAKAIIYAYDNGADVINMSFGGSACSIAVKDALATAYLRCVLVASAGNDGMPNEVTDYYLPQPNYPAALSYVIGVMSCGFNMTESSYTNWDAYLYNDLEYEVYAPGEQIISTLPNNKYGKLSGTSMAAPVVAAQAAILRSYFTDTERYPTKFIYGQIVGTAEDVVKCCNPKEHTVNKQPHNIPGCVSFFNSLDKLPNPDLGVSEYRIFDKEGGNGDGVIDAGETVDLGFMLKNRWGMATDVNVSVNATSAAGVDNPYVTFLNNDIDYGPVGTYSENDCGRIYDEATGDMWIGWENPFRIQIDKNCPNDMSVTINVTVTCKNGLNDNDKTVYTSSDSIMFTVRKGVVLPNKITEDMTLTKDNYYIIPNSMIVMKGATLTIEEGTKVQFWCSDPEDAYADTAITYLKVEGRLICKGTEAEPIEMFPSGWMDRYRVEIYNSNNGYISMDYTNITNPYININEANNCEFRQNYVSYLWYRELYNGQIQVYSGGSNIYGSCTECAFYKLWYCDLSGEFDSCIFVDSYIRHASDNYSNCVFYGNKNGGETSSITIGSDYSCNSKTVLYDSISGTTYVLLRKTYEDFYKYKIDTVLAQRFAEYLSGTYLETIDEDVAVFLKNKGYSDYSEYFIIAIPGDIYVTKIALEEYLVNLDMDSTYQINAELEPCTADIDALIFESEDEEIAVVDSKGKVTPVSQGTTNIRVYSKDRAVYNYVTVNVKDPVELTELKLDIKNPVINIGDSKRLNITFTPLNTTKKTITFESSDTFVARVDERGIIKAVSQGYADITVTGYKEISDTIRIQVVVPATGMKFKEGTYVTTLEKEDGQDFYPVITPEDATIKDIVWRSSNPEVCYVDEKGHLVKLKNGMATLKASLVGTEYTDEICIAVSDQAPEVDVVKMEKCGSVYYALMSDGTMWRWGGSYKTAQKLKVTGVKDFIVEDGGYGVYILDEEGYVRSYSISSDTMSESILNNVKALSENNNNVSDMYDKSYYAIKTDGSVWAWGYNIYGQLGVGGTNNTWTPLCVDLDDEICKVVGFCNTALYMSKDGKVYLSGGDNTKYDIPVLVETDAIDIVADNSSHSYAYVVKDDCVKRYDYCYGSCDSTYTIDKSPYYISNNNKSYIEDGLVYASGNNTNGKLGRGEEVTDIYYDDYKPMLNITNAKKVWLFSNNIYVQTTDGKLFATGKGNEYGLANADTNDAYTPVQIYLGLSENADPLVMENYAIEGKNVLVDMSTAIKRGTAYPNIQITDSTGEVVTINKSFDLDKLVLSPRGELSDGEVYTVTIPANALTTRFSVNNEAITFEFTYNASASTDEVTDSSDNKDETEDTTKDNDEIIEDDANIVHDTVTDEEELGKRHYYTKAEITSIWDKFVDEGRNTRFYSNAIINRLNDDNVESWLRIQAPDSSSYQKISIGNNYWGTSNMELIQKQILDFDDYQSLADLNEGAIMTEAPENTFPFVVDAYLEVNDEKTSVVGNELVTFVVEFNRDMDTDIELEVAFGSAYPHRDYQVVGEYVTPRKWVGAVQLNTLIENGYQYWSIRNGKAAGTSLKLYEDWGRFPFKIDTSAAQSLIMQGSAELDGIHLEWTQDDFETLAGFNVYRSTSEDGYYQKLNKTVINADTKEWFDDTVIPGTEYYYNFTVVQSDMKESEPSGKITITALDTMAPDIYHTPVYQAFTGSNLVISATVTDNVAVTDAKLYYRETGTDAWTMKTMSKHNDKYSAVISADEINVKGIDYYIEATDGISKTYKGSAEEPYQIVVQEAVSKSELGDVDGNGRIELKDAMMLLMAINDRLNLTSEEFARADIDQNGSLAAKEALRILQYVSGTITSVLP